MPSKDYPCPVCGAPMARDIDYIDHILMEEHMDCPAGCYSYDYLTGGSLERVGDREFLGHWTDGYQEFADRLRRVNDAIKHLRASKKAILSEGRRDG